MKQSPDGMAETGVNTPLRERRARVRTRAGDPGVHPEGLRRGPLGQALCATALPNSRYIPPAFESVQLLPDCGTRLGRQTSPPTRSYF